jgi:hypothetical protein
MAACANWLICLSSSSREAGAWFLVLGIVSPTTTTPIGALAIDSTHRHQIMSDDAPAEVSFKSDLTLVEGSLHSKAVFERAHTRFNARSPALATAKPTLFLSRRPTGAQAAAGRQNHLLDPRLEGRLFVSAVPEASVSSSQMGVLDRIASRGLAMPAPTVADRRGCPGPPHNG